MGKGSVSKNLTRAEGTISVTRFTSESQVKSLLVLYKNVPLLYTLGYYNCLLSIVKVVTFLTVEYTFFNLDIFLVTS